jgi:septum formation protein
MDTVTEIILASSSSYKYKLFSQLGLKFRAVDPGIEEVCSDQLDGGEQALSLSAQKAEALALTYPDTLIIGADQVLECGRELFQKPGSRENAVIQLRKLVGRTHFLHTAVTVLHRAESFVMSRLVTSKMKMSGDLPEPYLRYTVEKDRTWDCVGSYKIESLGITLFEQVDTHDFTAIVGLPLMTLCDILRERGFFQGPEDRS